MKMNTRTSLRLGLLEEIEEAAQNKGWRVQAEKREKKKAALLAKQIAKAAKERAQREMMEGFIRQHKNFLKYANRKQLRKGAQEVIMLTPPEILARVEARLGLIQLGGEKALINALLERVILLPKKQFLRLNNSIDEGDTRVPPAFAYKEYAFLNVECRTREGTRANTAHELCHVMNRLAGLSLGIVQDEALATAVGLYSRSKGTNRAKQMGAKFANELYRGRKDSTYYVEAVNLGREIFHEANALEAKHGSRGAVLLFYELFRVKNMNFNVVKMAANVADKKAEGNF